MKVKVDGFSMKVVDDLMLKAHHLRLMINKNHESGSAGSWKLESELLEEYYSVLQELCDYLEDDGVVS